MRRLELQFEEKEKQRQYEEREKEKQRQHELEIKKLELQSNPPRSTQHSEHFDITKNIRLVPPFQEKEVDKYFLHFEKIAENLKWPKTAWSTLLQSVLLGKARDIFTQLTVEQASDYEVVKELILKGYELVPEAYRQKFRHCQKEQSQTYVEFARAKEQLFDRWCISKKIEKDFEKLRQIVLIEEFKRCIPNSIKIFLDEQKAEKLETAACLADDYALTHKESFTKPFTNQNKMSSFSPQTSFPRNEKSKVTHENKISPETQKSKEEKSFSSPTCAYCKKSGHILSECFKLKRKQGFKPTGFISKHDKGCARSFSDEVQNTHSAVKTTRPPKHSSLNPVMDSFKPFTCEGFVSLTSDISHATPITILRDTGASQSLIVSNILPFSESSYSGQNVLIQGVDSSSYTTVPLHNVHLLSNIVAGPVVVGIRSSLPFEGVHLLLGNDLAGDKIIV